MAISYRELGAFITRNLKRTQTHRENLLCWVSLITNINRYQMTRVIKVSYLVPVTCSFPHTDKQAGVPVRRYVLSRTTVGKMQLLWNPDKWWLAGLADFQKA